MATVRPFKAIRPAKDKAARVTALPYDVMNRTEAAEMAKGNPDSFLHISRSEIDLPETEDVYCEAVYRKAKANIKKNLDSGVFVEESRPSLYIYRQEMDGRSQTGIVGCVSIDEYRDNTIKKHELTRIEKEEDRIRHFDVCGMDTEPVFLTYRDDKKIRKIVEEYTVKNEPEYDFTGEDGTAHVLYVIEDECVVEQLCDLFASVPSMYIADGHHRSASACAVGEKRRREHPGYTGDEEFNFFMAVIFPDTDLRIFDYNRVVSDLAGMTAEEFLSRIREKGFEAKKNGEKAEKPEKPHQFAMYLEGSWYRLIAPDSLIPDDVIGSLDVSVLQDNILGPLLGIEDPRTDKRIDFVGGIRGLGELKRRAESDMKVAFAVYPVTVEQLMEIADQGRIMPPKSTWFEPKLGSGLFMHRI